MESVRPHLFPWILCDYDLGALRRHLLGCTLRTQPIQTRVPGRATVQLENSDKTIGVAAERVFKCRHKKLVCVLQCLMEDSVDGDFSAIALS